MNSVPTFLSSKAFSLRKKYTKLSLYSNDDTKLASENENRVYILYGFKIIHNFIACMEPGYFYLVALSVLSEAKSI